MKRVFLFLLFTIPLARSAEPVWASGDRIVFAGDSITGAYKYVHYLQAYLQLRYPALDLHTYAIGKGGTNVANWVTSVDHTVVAQQYYDKYLKPLLPDYAFAKFGYNGSYTADEWQTDLEQLITNMGSAVPILLGPQPGSTTTGGTTLQSFSARMVTVATTGGYRYSDNWNSLVSIYTANTTFTASTDDTCTATAHGLTDGVRVLVDVATAPGGLADGIYWVRDATTNTFKLTATEGGAAVDITSTGSGTHRISRNWAALQYPGTQGTPATHHGTAGHYMDAYTCIDNLGFGKDVSAAALAYNAGSPTLTSNTDCTIGSIAGNAYDGVNFTRLDARLPMAIDEDGGRTRAEAIRMIPAMDGWQTYTLTVTGLTSGTYDVYIDGSVVASVSHSTLAAGWNMSELTQGPAWSKGQETLGCLRDLQGIDRTTLAGKSPNSGMIRWASNANVAYEDNGDRDAALVTSMASHQAHLDTLMAAVHAAAQPATLTFSLRRQGAGAASTAPSRTNRGRRAATAVTP